MPYKNKDKRLEENATFHAYNRGFEKRRIFKDSQDYAMFMYLLKKYLLPGFKLKRDLHVYEPKHLYNEVDLHAFCLMPNHFHLLLNQKTKYGMTKLLTRISSSYTRYFNEKYNKDGALWQGTYKATRIYSDLQFQNTMRYIHENPAEIATDVEKYEYSSFSAYLGNKNFGWLAFRGNPELGVAPK